ncbi:MAG: hypothetical protein RLZZ135_2210, partial [Cyanobacteriota bacterium]
RDVSAQLNQIVLEQTANLTLMWQIASGTNLEAIQQDYHDADDPTPLELDRDPTGGKLAIICDGIAGNIEGEAASQLAVKLLNIQTHNLFDDLLDRQDTATPEQIYNAISAIVRVVNNTIVAQHQSQRKQERRRMATTMVMAAQINQRVPSNDGSVKFSHEIYIAHIGNSRAYWITADRCELLTIDDNIATREVKQGRDLPWHSTIPPGATVLTQALGIDVGETIHPTIQRFMALEDGILLLCSNSLSDDNFVESSWPEYADNILNKGIPLDTAVRSWLALAHQQHGDNNSSMIPISCYVSPQISHLPSSQTMSIVKPTQNPANSAESSLTLLNKKTGYLPLIIMVIVGLSIALVIAVNLLRPNEETTDSNTPNQIEQPK